MRSIPRAPLGHRCLVAFVRLVAWLGRTRAEPDGSKHCRVGPWTVLIESSRPDGRIERTWYGRHKLRSEVLHTDARHRLTRDGECVEWRTTSARYETSHWLRGVRHGPYRLLWPNGRTRAYGSFVHGRADGEWWFTRRDGALDRARTGLWRDGHRIGGLKGFNDWLGSP